MRVKGSLAEFQSSMNFYLVLCSVSEYKTVDKLRKYYFDKFLEEEIKQAERQNVIENAVTLPLIESKEDTAVEDDVGEENPFVDSYFESGVGVDTSSDVDVEDTEEDLDSGESITPSGFLSQMLGNSEADEDFEEVHNEEPTTPSSFLTQMLNSHDGSSDVSGGEYIPGTYIEDIVIPSSEDISNDDVYDSEDFMNDSKSFIDAPVIPSSEVHGTYIEDIDVGSVENKEYRGYGTYIEDIEIPDVEDVESEEVEEISYEKEYEDIEEEYVENTEDVDEEPVEEVHGTYIEDIQVDSGESDYEGTEYEESEYEDVGESEYEDAEYEESEYVEEEYEEPDEEPVEIERPTVEKRKSVDNCKEEDLENGNIVAPADLREFLRKYPCSDISFVAKYYPKKEIEKQIMLGRVYKKKGKLMI